MRDDVANLSGVVVRDGVSIRMSASAWLLVVASLWASFVLRLTRGQEAGGQSELYRRPEARVPLLSNEQAWERLPELEAGGGFPLPAWARAIAGGLPRTTAAMLELDWLHRAMSPIDPKLRGMMRRAVARANRCEYTSAYAVSDLHRAGLEQSQIDRLDDRELKRPEAEQAALDFARKLTLAADTVTDEEVARLVEWYGDKQVVAMALLIAHANFQDRLFLSLGLEAEPDHLLPPVSVRFVKGQSSKSITVPERRQPDAPSVDGRSNEAPRIDEAEWLSVDFAALQRKLESQRKRTGRIRVPAWDEVLPWLPERSRRNDPLRIKWSLVCVGYQPELALAWSACTRAFGEEAKQDRVFEESLFWVITRTIDCFY